MALNLLVTGAAGFIGAHLCQALAKAGHSVTGCDALFDGDPELALRRARVRGLLQPWGVRCERVDLSVAGAAEQLLQCVRPDAVVHLAARPGVRDSVRSPLDSVTPNLVAFAHVLHACQAHRVGHLLYASSSSVYGKRSTPPFVEHDRCEEPASFYAATKKANELMAYSFASVHGLPVTGLRLFTVYGPWGRPDMACHQFARRIRRGEPVVLFGQGLLQRDFTYIDDVTDALCRLVERGPGAAGPVPAEIFNVGHRHPVSVSQLVDALELALERKAIRTEGEMPPGDVPLTCADDSRLLAAIGPWPATPLAVGLQRYAKWFSAWEALSSDLLATGVDDVADLDFERPSDRLSAGAPV